MEKWENIVGYEGYKVSNKGNVKNARGRLLKPMGESGRVLLIRPGGYKKTALIRYLVANAFVPNPDPDELCFVAYINGDKNNNQAENLEWKPHPHRKKVICVETGEVYNSIDEAAGKNHISSVAISRVCRSFPHHNTAGGYHWKYFKQQNEVAEMRGITKDRIYNAIVEYIDRNGYPPTYREIGEMVGLKSTSTIFFHIERLIDEGKIEVRGRRESRAIRVIGYKFVKEEQPNGDTSGYQAEAEPSQG